MGEKPWLPYSGRGSSRDFVGPISGMLGDAGSTIVTLFAAAAAGVIGEEWSSCGLLLSVVAVSSPCLLDMIGELACSFWYTYQASQTLVSLVPLLSPRLLDSKLRSWD